MVEVNRASGIKNALKSLRAVYGHVRAMLRSRWNPCVPANVPKPLHGWRYCGEEQESYRTVPMCGAHWVQAAQGKRSPLTWLEPAVATWRSSLNLGRLLRLPCIGSFTGQFARPNRDAERGCRRATAPGKGKVRSVSSKASKMLPFFDRLWPSSRTRCAISAASGLRRRSRGSARLFHPRLGSPHSSYRLRSSFRHACNLLPGSRRRHAAVVSLSLHCANSCGARAAL